MAQNNSKKSGDIHDSKRDEKYLKQEETVINLPDVEDIPGQENIRPPKINEMADTTASSDDEEGKSLFEDEEINNDTNVTPVEKELLKRSSESMASPDDEAVINAELDKTDSDGEPLNESVDVSGDDLDVPGAELDDADEETGEEDEENNSYSLGQ